MSDLIENRQIRVFISSTFNDMQDERDYLINRTFPYLRKLAAERDVTLTELDLRWGITEDEAKSGKVVEICFREIENSVPFFIGIIGDRYGWVPSKEDISGNLSNKFKEVDSYLENHLSVTEMEMQFGVLEREEDMHAFFFIKEDTDKACHDNPEMMVRLKEKVKGSRYPSSDYSSPEDLAKQVKRAFISLLDSLFPAGHISDLEKERIGQRYFMRQLCQSYIPDGKSFHFLDKWMADWAQHDLVITGASGLGKSALMANWLNRKLSEPGREYNVIYHFIGNGGSESSKYDICRYICNEIEELYHFENGTKYSESKLEDLISEVDSKGEKSLLIVLDAINQIADIEDAKLLNWIPTTTGRVKIMFSTLETDKTMSVFRNRSYPEYAIYPLGVEERKHLIIDYLKSYGKSLSEPQVALLVSDGKCENTMTLKTLLNQLINYGLFDKLDDRIKHYLSSKTIDDFYQTLLSDYEVDYGKKQIKHALSLIALSQYGLSEKEIMSMSGEWRALEWSQFYCAFINHLTVKSGKILFSHKYILDAVNRRYIDGHKKWEESCRFDILYHISQNYGIPYFYELPYQLYKIGSKQTLSMLYNTISDPAVAATLYEKDRSNIIEYWKCLKRQGYSLEVYKDKCLSASKMEVKQQMTFSMMSLLRLFGERSLVIDIAERKLREAEESGIEDKEVLAEAYNDVANSYLDDMTQERFQTAFEYYLKAVDLLKGTQSAELGNAYNGIAILSVKANRADFVIEFAQKALNLSMLRYGGIHQEVANNLDILAHGYEMNGEWEKAKENYEKSISLMVAIHGRMSEELAWGYYKYASRAFEHKEYEKAFQLIRKGIETIEDTFGNEYYGYSDFVKLKDAVIEQL